MKKLMVCVDLNNDSVELIKKRLKSWHWNEVDEVHFVHGFQLQVYADAFYAGKYPLEAEYDQIEKSVVEVLKEIEDDIFGEKVRPKVINKCIFSISPKNNFEEYIKENKIDEVVIGSRGKHGVKAIFSSSFASYMVRHADAELRIIRDKFQEE